VNLHHTLVNSTNTQGKIYISSTTDSHVSNYNFTPNYFSHTHNSSGLLIAHSCSHRLRNPARTLHLTLKQVHRRPTHLVDQLKRPSTFTWPSPSTPHANTGCRLEQLTSPFGINFCLIHELYRSLYSVYHPFPRGTRNRKIIV
jgi:hypothetical protein